MFNKTHFYNQLNENNIFVDGNIGLVYLKDLYIKNLPDIKIYKSLEIHNCKNLKSLHNLSPFLESLRLFTDIEIFDIDSDIHNLKLLEIISNDLKHIVSFPKSLRQITIKSDKLKNIPIIPDNTTLAIFECKELLEIPNIPLKLISCSDCENLIRLPRLRKNIAFICDNCRPQIREIERNHQLVRNQVYKGGYFPIDEGEIIYEIDNDSDDDSEI